MKQFFNKLLGRSNEDYDDYDDEEYEDGTYGTEAPADKRELSFQNQRNTGARPSFREEQMRPNAPGSRVVEMANGRRRQEVIISQPKNVLDCQPIIDHVKAGRSVICNIEKVDPSNSQRIIDFLCGGSYGLNGSLTPVSSRIFIVAPNQTLVSDGNYEDEYDHSEQLPADDYLRQIASMGR